MTSPLLRQSALRPISVLWPIHDDGVYGHWLVPGDRTRGQAIAFVSQEEGDDFTAYRAHRVYYRWSHHDFRSAGWRLEDGTLVVCARGDDQAEAYWEVTRA